MQKDILRIFLKNSLFVWLFIHPFIYLSTYLFILHLSWQFSLPPLLPAPPPFPQATPPFLFRKGRSLMSITKTWYIMQ